MTPQARQTTKPRGAVPARPDTFDRSESGAVLVIVAFAVVAFLLIAALVIDVGFAYAVGRQDQTVADLSALAAAQHLPGDPVAACTTAWSYVKANLGDLPAGATSPPCGNIPAAPCDPSDPADYTATATGPYTITFRYPVPDNDPLMSSRPIVQPADGTNPCERFGVKIAHQDAQFFSGIGGIGALTPRVQAVSRHWTGSTPGDVANLVSLDPIGCVGIEANGASNTQTITQVIVNSYSPGSGKPPIPGAIAVDSDGSACSGGKTTVDGAGAAQLYAEPTTGSDPGQISLYALAGDQATCVIPACNPSQVPSNVAPQPISSASRVTRAPADHAYNCKSSYPVEYDALVPIAGCDTSDPTNGGPYIDDLTNAVRSYSASNLPTGYTRFPTCSPSSGTYTGNWWVDCPNGNGFKITNGTTVKFQGNVIFDGSVNQSGGELDFTGDPGGSISSSCETSVCLDASSPQASFVYLNGSMGPTSSSYVLNFTDTFVYVTATSGAAISQDPSNFGCGTQKGNSITSNGGTSSWIAPNDGPFKNLALWSESGSGNNSSGNSSTASFGLHGGGNTTVDGVFFTPCAQFNISGGFTNPQTAQFLTFQLSVGGGSQLIMVPDPQRLLKTEPSGSNLIR